MEMLAPSRREGGLRSAVRLGLLLLFVAALCSACGSTRAETGPVHAPATPTTPAPLVTPTVVLGRLTTTATLAAAAAEFARALQIDAGRVRVRLNTGECTTCSIGEYQENTSLAGLAVEDAALRVAAGNQVYLVVPRFACIYDFDGDQFTPRECRFTPL